MANKPYRIILDTNLWIGFLISKNRSVLESVLFSGQARLLFSMELLSEFTEVVKRPKFQKYFSGKDIEDILKTIDEYADFIKVSSKIEICRDMKDNFLLSLALDGHADYLLTGDVDLLVLKKIGRTKIITMSKFLVRVV
jgi:putative PIN family toxin of toxin-antitoxin system